MDKPVPPPSETEASDELKLLLREIEKEAVPERLMELALKLQKALSAQRLEGQEQTDRSERSAPVSSSLP